MSITSVLYVRRRDAKTIKSHLEDLRDLDKRYRMVPTNSDAIIYHDSLQLDVEQKELMKSEILTGQCIAVPVVQPCIDKLHQYPWSTQIVGVGVHHCPFSTSMGNSICRHSQNIICASPASNDLTPNAVQRVLADTLMFYVSNRDGKHITTRNTQDSMQSCHAQTHIVDSVLALSNKTCPKKLEIIGDDRTLTVPRSSWYLMDSSDSKILVEKQNGENEFLELLRKFEIQSESDQMNFQSLLWENLAISYRCIRVVRRGDIDPESGVRESGHRILWPKPINSTGNYNKGFISPITGKDSPGWITVTEHRISQSFDLTRVMFSRGNVTEKKRFASLVQEGERVLDMYAGIGYYTLPALVHGKAEHVTACEWNPNAIYALRHNLNANGVENRATLLEGDCRVSLEAHLVSKDDRPNQTNFDRVSLGLLPSSEGGWDIAIACLNQSIGGWLHIHGNVPTAERRQWAHWVCQSLKLLTEQHNHSKEWNAICTHVEKVKSYAPMIDHVVADVFVGPEESQKIGNHCCSGVIDSTGEFDRTVIGEIDPPSCALSKDGILHQDWMMSA